MPILLLLALAAPTVSAADRFTVQTDLKALYDEISSVAVGTMASQDVTALRSAIYMPDWTFTDARGLGHTWEETRGASVNPGGEPPAFMEEAIRKLTLTADGATVIVDLTALRSSQVPGSDVSHTTAERTTFRDAWVRTDGTWRFRSRKQLGDTRQHVPDPYRPGP